MDKLKITWLGHSCFKLECGGHSAVIDPYKDVQGYPDISCSAGAVFASHDHYDHGYVEGVKIVKEEGENPFRVTVIDCFHDEEQGVLRGRNKITVFEAAGKKVAHFGDLGHMISQDMVEQLKGLDAALIPVGGFYTIYAETAHAIMLAIDPKVTVPMHYRTGSLGFDVIAEPEDFLNLVTDRKVIRNSSNSFEIADDMEKSVLLLTFEGAEK